MDTPLSRAFGFNTATTQKLMGNFAADELDRRVGEASPARWIVGHIASSRAGLGKMIGCDVEAAPWAKEFGIGTTSEPSDDWPPMDEMLAEFAKTGAALSERLEAMSAPDFEAEAKAIISDEKVTVGHNVQFLFFHDSYHVGQIGLIGRSFGHERLA